MKLRRLTPSGMRAFRAWLATCRMDPTASLPLSLLEDAATSEPVHEGVEPLPQRFAARRTAAEYLSDLLAPLDSTSVKRDAGLWSWLTLFYFDEVCPQREGRRTVRNDYHYVFEPDNQRHWYRHLLHLGWRVLLLAPAYNRLFLDVPLSRLDKATIEIVKRLFITRIPCIFEVVDRLYWDEACGRIRSGMVDSQRTTAGDITHRLPIRIRQLERTFDLQSLSADQLIELLGNEFAFQFDAKASAHA